MFAKQKSYCKFQHYDQFQHFRQISCYKCPVFIYQDKCVDSKTLFVQKVIQQSLNPFTNQISFDVHLKFLSLEIVNFPKIDHCNTSKNISLIISTSHKGFLKTVHCYLAIAARSLVMFGRPECCLLE